MKFTDGYWRIKDGVTINNATQVRDIRTTENSVTVFAACKVVTKRGETFNEPLITVNYSSPMKDVICVKAYHHKGRRDRGPNFELNRFDDTVVQISDNEIECILTSNKLSVRIAKDENWRIDYLYSDIKITGNGYKSTAYIRDSAKNPFMREQMNLGVGEYVYGLGERFTSFVKNGQTVDMWNDDGGTSSELAYKNVPFYVTNRGYGVLVNHPEKVSFEVATENVSRVQFSVPGEYLEYYVIGGSSLKEVLQNYTTLTGKPTLPPAWSFGLWLSTSTAPEHDELIVKKMIEEMQKRDLPLHVFYFCCFWMKEYQFSDFKWNNDAYPDPVSMLRRMKEKGLKISVWVNPYVAQKSHLFDEGMEKGYFIKTRDGDVWQWDRWQAGMALVDFTNPDAYKWYQSKLEELVDMGVDTFKTDFGERVPTDVVYHNGSDPEKMHNFYAYLYQKAVFEVLVKKVGKKDALTFGRTGTVGCQKFPLHWGGDSSSTYDSMAETLRGGLSLGLCGFGFWSHDISGFEQMATPDLYKRWTAFGMLTSHSRLHGNNSYRMPWLFDDKSVDVLRYFTKLKCSIMPYLFNVSSETAESGIPLMRAMVLEFDEDPACAYIDRQYMLGDSLLVAPIFSEDGIVSYYLPSGVWTNFITGEKVVGEGWKQEKHSYMSLPLMVRPNSVIAVGNNDIRPDYDYADSVTLHLFELEDGGSATARVCNTDGQQELKVLFRRKGQMVSVNAEGSGKPWSILMRGVAKLSEVKNAVSTPDPLGIKIIPEINDGEISYVLEN